MQNQNAIPEGPQRNIAGGDASPYPTTPASTTPAPKPRVIAKDDLPPANRGRWGTVIISVILSLVAGAGGGWAYQKYGPRPQSEPATADTSAASAPAAAAVSAPSEEVKNVSEGLDSVRDRVKQLEDQISTLPKTQPTAEISDLRSQIGELRKSSQTVDADDKKVEALAVRLHAAEKAVTKSQEELDHVRTEVDAMRTRIDEARTNAASALVPRAEGTATRDTAHLLTGFDPDLDGGFLTKAGKLMQEHKYADALKVLEELQKTHQDDARVWYFSALARGFSTNDWRGETERLVEKGVERERAGTPSNSKIDSSFSMLKKETGKDWLDAYRARARESR
jgi:hypothetical protein